MGDEVRGVVGVQFVLRGAGNRDVCRHIPDRARGHEICWCTTLLGVVGDTPALNALDLFEELEVDPVLIDDVATGIRAGHNPAAELVDLVDRIQCDVAGAGDDDALAVEVLSPGVEHLAHEEDDAIAGGLGPHLRAAPRQSFAGEYAGLVAVGDALVLPEEVADFPTTDADITRRDVGVLADMAVQLGHE